MRFVIRSGCMTPGSQLLFFPFFPAPELLSSAHLCSSDSPTSLCVDLAARQKKSRRSCPLSVCLTVSLLMSRSGTFTFKWAHLGEAEQKLLVTLRYLASTCMSYGVSSVSVVVEGRSAANYYFHHLFICMHSSKGIETHLIKQRRRIDWASYMLVKS